MAKLRADWTSIFVGNLSDHLEPVRFTGKKCRRLLVNIIGEAVAPWGDWSRLPYSGAERRKFTALRKAINASIYPHEVDHVDFEYRISPIEEFNNLDRNSSASDRTIVY